MKLVSFFFYLLSSTYPSFRSPSIVFPSPLFFSHLDIPPFPPAATPPLPLFYFLNNVFSLFSTFSYSSVSQSPSHSLLYRICHHSKSRSIFLLSFIISFVFIFPPCQEREDYKKRGRVIWDKQRAELTATGGAENEPGLPRPAPAPLSGLAHGKGKAILGRGKGKVLSGLSSSALGRSGEDAEDDEDYDDGDDDDDDDDDDCLEDQISGIISDQMGSDSALNDEERELRELQRGMARARDGYRGGGVSSGARNGSGARQVHEPPPTGLTRPAHVVKRTVRYVDAAGQERVVVTFKTSASEEDLRRVARNEDLRRRRREAEEQQQLLRASEEALQRAQAESGKSFEPSASSASASSSSSSSSTGGVGGKVTPGGKVIRIVLSEAREAEKTTTGKKTINLSQISDKAKVFSCRCPFVRSFFCNFLMDFTY